MSMRLAYALVLLSLAVGCDEHAGTEPDRQGVGSGRDAATGDQPYAADGSTPVPDAGKQPAQTCSSDAAKRAKVIMNGDTLTPLMVAEQGEWLSFAGSEVFRLRLSASFDPIPEAADDEFDLFAILDVMPSAVARGGVIEFEQRVDVESSRDESYENDKAVRVTLAPGQSAYMRRVLVERRSFSRGTAASSYRVQGKLSLAWREQKLFGTLSLELHGTLPHAPADEVSLSIRQCFELALEIPAACMPGKQCGNDCYGPEDYACSACGELYYTHDCHCRPYAPPLPECESAEPAAEGELCGEYWWCNRACARGLQCKEDSGYGLDADAGITNSDRACNYFTCQPQ